MELTINEVYFAFFPKKKQKNILKQYFCNVLTGFGAPWWLIAAAHAEQKNEMTEYIFNTFFLPTLFPYSFYTFDQLLVRPSRPLSLPYSSTVSRPLSKSSVRLFKILKSLLCSAQISQQWRWSLSVKSVWPPDDDKPPVKESKRRGPIPASQCIMGLW